jgi:hypothetical protein
VRKYGACAAFVEASNVNAARMARDLPPVTLLHRPSGRVFAVAPDADVLVLSGAFERREVVMLSGAAIDRYRRSQGSMLADWPDDRVARLYRYSFLSAFQKRDAVEEAEALALAAEFGHIWPLLPREA